MKLIIAGSRNVTEYDELKHAIVNLSIVIHDVTEVVSGGARGADALGEKFAKEYNIPLKIFPANWDKHGKSAGYIRNAEMAKYADTLLALWDEESRGTKHMIDLMSKEKKKTYVYVVKKEQS